MAEDDGLLGPGRRYLKDGLGRLLQKSGLTQSQAIGRVNSKPGATLQKQTVSDWFAGNPPASFEPLWLLIQTFLIAAGRETPDDLRKTARSANESDSRTARQALGAWDATRGYWEQVWLTARQEPGPAPDPRLSAYLTAARQAAATHPYPWPDGDPPPLGQIYVRQETRPETTHEEATAGSPQPTALLEDGSASRPVAHVFEAAEPCCVLLSGPGGGKSTQARMHLAAAADRWLQRFARRKVGRADSAVPVLVRASALAGTTPLPQALATAVAEDLAEFAPLLDLTGLFDRHPLPRTPWLVVVDGLDEIPDGAARAQLLRTVATAADTHPSLYRFTVLTRPLPAGELDALDPGTTRYTLQPFSPEDLHDYARRCFHRLPGHSPGDDEEHAVEFIAQLARSRLHTLGRTPLMAFMLTRLYAADPGRSLPEGRSGAYGAFVGLVYKRNSHKGIARTQAAAIRDLADRYQEAADRRTAEQAARQAADHLTEIIGSLAHERLHGDTDLAARIAARHPRATRPESIDEHHWHRLLNDLLRPTGLLTQRGHDLDFLHQTVTEYLAAHHATRDDQACARLLAELFPPRRRLQAPVLEPSYLGFLVDALLASPGTLAAQTARRLEVFIKREKPDVCRFLVSQLCLRTNLPVELAVRQLTLFATRTAYSLERVLAADGLARVEGYEDRGAQLLITLAGESAHYSFERVRAAERLAQVDGYLDRGAAFLIAFAEDATFAPDDRVEAANLLRWVDGYEDRADELLSAFVEDSSLDGAHRLRAADRRGWMDGTRNRMAEDLGRLAEDSTLDGSHRLQAADRLSWMDGYRNRAAELLLPFAEDATLDPSHRMKAAEGLVRANGYPDRTAELLVAFATDTALAPSDRVHAAGLLRWVDGCGARAAELLHSCAEDTTLDPRDRVCAARNLAQVDGYLDLGAGLLVAFATDTTLDPFQRVWAARYLAGVDGYLARGAQFLIAFAKDTALDPFQRVCAAKDLAEVEGYLDRGAELLIAFAKDTALDPFHRIEAAKELVEVEGYLARGAQFLIAFAEDTALDLLHRVEAAEGLDWVEGYMGRAVELRARLPGDDIVWADFREGIVRGPGRNCWRLIRKLFKKGVPPEQS
ncbi:NACHT domain-containing NTPase [Streptomyces sp. NBC_00103]|uniref:NACHT domain-containing protein n=1 Tax=Streptomyces sp. NBC_00103 TaxID=2975653 RepID=UPI0022516004|nr:hypothetical protein [Streptomyces sp. NBC_00103]MCX5374799.1 ATP-binding protein [Streptomyces sp. NBC_00103]